MSRWLALPVCLLATPALAAPVTPLQAVAQVVGNFPETAEGRPRLTVNLTAAAHGRLQATAIATGLADDAISARRWNLTLRQGQRGWRVAARQESWRCARGENTQNWTTTRCP